MAAIYTLGDSTSITIGGTTSTGPFPKYSISRSIVEAGDGTIIGNTYNITISGSVIVDSAADITNPGELQNDIHGKIIHKLQMYINSGTNIGRLEIVPYGGLGNTIDFADARLLSVDIPEQDDASAGMLFTNYSLTFEARTDISNGATAPFDYNLKSASESWQISIDEQEVAYDSTPSGTPKRTYTITHTVSASSAKKLTSDADFDRSGWKDAAEWVKTRLVSSPATVIATDTIGNPEFSNFNPELFDTSSSSVSIDLSSFNYYNHTRVPNADLLDGSYSVTETWKASPVAAILEMNIDTNQDEQDNITMTLSGSITGLDSSSLNDATIDKYTNANNVLTIIDSTAFSLCNTYYSGDGSLTNLIRNKSIGRNKGTGVITFSYSFNDIPILIDNAISTSLRLNYNNENHVTQVNAIIPIIAKSGGPIIQDMNTSEEQRLNVQIDAVMKKAYRTTKPTTPRTLGLSYAPANGRLVNNNENWEPNTGVYSISMEWVY